MHPPQASEKRREIDPLKAKCMCNIKHLSRGGERRIRTGGTDFRTRLNTEWRDFSAEGKGAPSGPARIGG
jgi:hypothetical protein